MADNTNGYTTDRAAMALRKMSSGVDQVPIFLALADSFEAFAREAASIGRSGHGERDHLLRMADSCRKRSAEQKRRSDFSPSWGRDGDS